MRVELPSHIRSFCGKRRSEWGEWGQLEAINGLAKMPHRHGPVQEIQREEIVFRRGLKWSYNIIFVIEEAEVAVWVVARMTF